MAIRILFKYLYLTFLQKVYISVVHVQRNTYEIQYVLHDQLYKIRTKTRRGPPRIVGILDHHGDDIAGEVVPYLGPNDDFHGQTIRPCDIGYEEIHIMLRNGVEKIFKTDEYIQLNNE